MATRNTNKGRCTILKTNEGKNFISFTEEVLLRDAGQAQIAAGTSRKEWQVYENKIPYSDRQGVHTRSRVLAPPYSDDPYDQEMIKRGFKYYGANKNNLQEED